MQKIKNILNYPLLKTILMLLISVIMLSACGEREVTCNKAEADANNMTCEEYIAKQQKECWQAQILNMLYNAMGEIAMNAYTDLTQGAMSAMMIIFAIWFSYKLLKYIGSIKEEDSVGKFWTGILKQLFLCFACGYLASSTQGLLYVLNNMLFPVFNAFLELASVMLAQLNSVNEAREIPVFGEPYDTEQDTCVVSEQLLYTPANEDGFPQGANAMMQCLICNIAEKFSIGFELSYKVMGLGLFFPKVVGFTLLAIFTFVKLGFVFYLVETIFKFTMMAVMLPIFLLGYPFEKTRGWLISALKIILSGAAYVLAISVVVSLAIVAIIKVMDNNPMFNGPLTEFTVFSPTIMVLLMIAFLVKKTMDVASKLANTFTGSQITSKFAKALGGMLKMAGQAIGSVISIGSLAPVFAKYNWMKKIYDRTMELKAKVEEIQDKVYEAGGGRDPVPTKDDDEEEGK